MRQIVGGDPGAGVADLDDNRPFAAAQDRRPTTDDQAAACASVVGGRWSAAARTVIIPPAGVWRSALASRFWGFLHIPRCAL